MKILLAVWPFVPLPSNSPATPGIGVKIKKRFERRLCALTFFCMFAYNKLLYTLTLSKNHLV